MNGYYEKSPRERTIACLVYGSIADTRSALHGVTDRSILEEALTAARKIREGRTKVAMIEVVLRKLPAAAKPDPVQALAGDLLAQKKQLETALSACRSIRFATNNAVRHGGEYSLNDLLAADKLAREALGEKGGAS